MLRIRQFSRSLDLINIKNLHIFLTLHKVPRVIFENFRKNCTERLKNNIFEMDSNSNSNWCIFSRYSKETITIALDIVIDLSNINTKFSKQIEKIVLK